MSVSPPDPVSDAAAAGIARVVARRATAGARLAAATADVLVPDELRLDEAARSGVRAALRAAVNGIERALCAAAELSSASDGYDRLAAAGLLADPALMSELIDRVRLQRIAVGVARTRTEGPSLLASLTDEGDGVLAKAAVSMLALDRSGATALPFELHRRVTWWLAAALGGDDRERQQRVEAAADMVVAGHDEDEEAEATALRLAAALAARGHALPALLIEAIGDGELLAAAALLAVAAEIPYPAARALLVDPTGEELSFALYALRLPPRVVAAALIVLHDADPARSVDDVADLVEVLAEMPVETAAALVATCRLDPELRRAAALLGHAR